MFTCVSLGDLTLVGKIFSVDDMYGGGCAALRRDPELPPRRGQVAQFWAGVDPSPPGMPCLP